MSEELKAALARIACLEGEIAKRDARIVELENIVDKAWNRSHQLEQGAYIQGALDAWKRPVLQNLPYDFSGNPGAPATQYCNGWNDAGGYWKAHVDDLLAELSAIKAQEPSDHVRALNDALTFGIGMVELNSDGNSEHVPAESIYAAPVSDAAIDSLVDELRIDAEALGLSVEVVRVDMPVSEAKAQGVVLPDERSAFEKWGETLFFSACFERHGSDEYAGRGLQGAWLGWQARAALNAAPVQQVSVQDVSAMARILADRNADACNVNREDNWAIYGQDYIDDVTAMLAAAPAAPAADASDVLDQAMYTLISIGYHENSGLVHELRQALAAHSAKGVV